MKSVRLIAAIALIAAYASPALAQPSFPKPGPEHELLKKMEGIWDLTMKAGGMEHKGSVNYKMELGGLWLVGSMDCDLGGEKFHGKGLDTYDAEKKVYRSIWVDSMSASPMIFEGTYDKEKKTLTMTGDGPAPDGKGTAKWKSVSVMKDDDTMEFSMYVADGKEPMFVIVYKRKK